MDTPVRQASTLDETAHRPWPVPDRAWVMGQTWDDLLFIHYRVPVEQLRPHVPDGLELQEHSGSGWLGVTPFVVTGLRARGLFPLPFASSFRELNVRTYVTRDGKPGIWFFSLDASSQAAVEAARRLYRLPYFRADISVRRRGDELLYDCSRDDGKAFSASYGPVGGASPPEPGSLEHFLTERYCLYAAHQSRLYRADIHHRPWPLQKAQAQIDLNTMPPLKLPDDDPLLHYSARQDVVIWPLDEA
ncbi:MAG: YqjF family protein [Gaiellaceae bacterium]